MIFPWGTILAIFMALFQLSALSLPPVKGLPDNGDFWRVTDPAGLCRERPSGDSSRQHLQLKYRPCPMKWEKAHTSAVLPVLLIRLAGGLIGKNFDLRLLGIFYWLIFWMGMFFLWKEKAGSAILALWALASSHTLFFFHFNSFFSEALFLSCLPFLLAFFLKFSRLTLLIFWSLLMALSKAQYVAVPFLCLLTLLFVHLARRLDLKKSQWGLVVVGLGWAQVISLFFYFREGSPYRTDGLLRMNRFQAAFTGILQVSSNPQATLKVLNLPSGYSDLAGLAIFELPSGRLLGPDLVAGLDRLSLTRLALSYISDPPAIARSFFLLGKALFPFPFSWSGWVWGVWLVPVISLFIVFRGPSGSRAPGFLYGPLCFLTFHFWTQIPIAVLGDGFYSIGRHLVSAQFSSLLLAALLLVSLVTSLRSTDGS